MQWDKTIKFSIKTVDEERKKVRHPNIGILKLDKNSDLNNSDIKIEAMVLIL